MNLSAGVEKGHRVTGGRQRRQGVLCGLHSYALPTDELQIHPLLRLFAEFEVLL